MAIKNKIPSPDKVKKSPVKFSSEELEEIKKLQADISNLTFQFGQFKISKIKLLEQEKVLKNHLSNLEKKEITLAERLSSKYGKGSLDLNTGEFIPLK